MKIKEYTVYNSTKTNLKIPNKHRFNYDTSTCKWSESFDDDELDEANIIYESSVSPKMGCSQNGKIVSFRHVKLVNCDPPKSQPEV